MVLRDASNRRLSLALKGPMFWSWRSSKSDLEVREEDIGCSTRSERLPSPREIKRVHFPVTDIVTEIPEEENPITEEELMKSWFKVRGATGQHSL